MNPCKCGCGQLVQKNYAKGHGRRRPLRDRLVEKIDVTPACWLWTGAQSNNGYGRIGIGGHATDQVHRVAYELFVGPIPDGHHIDHLCRVRHCVNPAHLEAVTQAENNRRAAAANHRTHCRKGHEFTPENTLLRKGTAGRFCRTCKNAGQRALRRRSLEVTAA